MERVGRKCTIEDMIEGDRYLTFLLISQKKKTFAKHSFGVLSGDMERSRRCSWR